MSQIETELKPSVDMSTVACPQCGSLNWNVSFTSTARITPFHTIHEPLHQSGEEIRCSACGRKANKDIEVEVRKSEQYLTLRLEVEVPE